MKVVSKLLALAAAALFGAEIVLFLPNLLMS